jgi:hypothetical protein
MARVYTNRFFNRHRCAPIRFISEMLRQAIAQA